MTVKQMLWLQLVVWPSRLQCCVLVFLNDSTGPVNQITYQSYSQLAGLVFHSTDLFDCTEYIDKLPQGYVNTGGNPESSGLKDYLFLEPPYKVTENKEQTHYHLLHRQVVLKSGCMLESFGEFLKY